MSQAFHLLQLQKIDTQLDQGQSRLSQIDRILESNESLRQATSSYEAAKYEVKTAQEVLVKTEAAVQAQRLKIDTAEASLYSGNIRIPKELQDLQKDILSLKRHVAALEDEQLEAMVLLEQFEAVQTAASGQVAKVQAEVASQSASLLGEQSQLIKNQERLNTERLAAHSQISADNLAIYQKLREQKRGLAVCPVEDNACAGCGSTLRPEERQAARSPIQVVRCGSCGRILYAG